MPSPTPGAAPTANATTEKRCSRCRGRKTDEHFTAKDGRPRETCNECRARDVVKRAKRREREKAEAGVRAAQNIADVPRPMNLGINTFSLADPFGAPPSPSPPPGGGGKARAAAATAPAPPAQRPLPPPPSPPSSSARYQQMFIAPPPPLPPSRHGQMAGQGASGGGAAGEGQAWSSWGGLLGPGLSVPLAPAPPSESPGTVKEEDADA